VARYFHAAGLPVPFAVQDLDRPMKTYRIAAIPGDGIGKEVLPEGIRVMEAAGKKFGIAFKWDHFPWSCEYYKETGHMMPAMTRSSSARSVIRACRTTSRCGAC
jgi:isocitrate dehydrogenase